MIEARTQSHCHTKWETGLLIHYPPEETCSQRKLSRPWYRPYRITELSDTGVTAVKVYSPQDGAIQVHASRVSRCPPSFPAGSYWYGNRRHGRGRPPKWVEKLLSDGTEENPETNPSESGEGMDEAALTKEGSEEEARVRGRISVPAHSTAYSQDQNKRFTDPTT